MSLYAFVTGGSSGIGLEIAKELARRKYNLILVGTNPQKLTEARRQIHELNPDIEIITETADLSKRENVLRLGSEYKDKVQILINNAGVGLWKFVTEQTPEEIENVIQLNSVAPLLLIREFAESLNENSGYILNLSSEISSSPTPKFTVYAATKAFNRVFGEALRRELQMQKMKVSLTTVLPKATDTDFFNRSGMTEEEKQKLFSTVEKPDQPEKVAKAALEAMFARKSMLTIGLDNKLKQFASRFMPDELASKAAEFMFPRNLDMAKDKNQKGSGKNRVRSVILAGVSVGAVILTGLALSRPKKIPIIKLFLKF